MEDENRLVLVRSKGTQVPESGSVDVEDRASDDFDGTLSITGHESFQVIVRSDVWDIQGTSFGRLSFFVLSLLMVW